MNIWTEGVCINQNIYANILRERHKGFIRSMRMGVHACIMHAYRYILYILDAVVNKVR